MSEPLRREVRVRCDAARAFEAFTAEIDAWWPRTHRRWDASRMVLEPVLGGRVLEIASSGEEAELGRVIAWDPPRALAYTWRPGAIAGPTRVDVRFVSERARTRVEIVHSEGEAAMGAEWPKRAERFARAWSEVLPAFGRHAGLASASGDEESEDGEPA